MFLPAVVIAFPSNDKITYEDGATAESSLSGWFCWLMILVRSIQYSGFR